MTIKPCSEQEFNSFLVVIRSVSLPNSIQEEAEFDGDPTLELISDEKAQEMERPAWAKKIMSCVQPKGMQFPFFAPISNNHHE